MNEDEGRPRDDEEEDDTAPLPPSEEGSWGPHSTHRLDLPPPDAMGEDGRPLWKRESVEEPLPPLHHIIKIGPWWFTILFYAMLFSLGVIWMTFFWNADQGSVDGHHHGPHHGEIVKLPPEVQKHVKGGWEYGTIGSRKWIFGDHGWTELQRGHRDDSKLVVADTEFNSFTVKEYTRGCGRGWTKTDKNGARPGVGVRNTRCNMLYHQTGEERIDGGYDWTIPSYHRDPGRG